MKAFCMFRFNSYAHTEHNFDYNNALLKVHQAGLFYVEQEFFVLTHTLIKSVTIIRGCFMTNKSLLFQFMYLQEDTTKFTFRLWICDFDSYTCIRRNARHWQDTSVCCASRNFNSYTLEGYIIYSLICFRKEFRRFNSYTH